jgi:deoxyribonuclease V
VKLQLAIEHRWDMSPREARALQNALRSRVEVRDRLDTVETVGGLDVGFRDGGRVTHAAVAVLDAHELRLVDCATAEVPTRFPYVPGLLSFREIPALLAALERLHALPKLLLCDGQGTAHPRRFGVACHLGVLLDHPTIGVAKTRLVGSHAPVPEHKGAWTPLLDGDEVIGAVVRTRAGVKPLYVSTGHRVSLSTAVSWLMRCVTRYRLPETTRISDRLASHKAKPPDQR